MTRFSLGLTLMIVSACTIGASDGDGTPGEGPPGDPGSGDGTPSTPSTPGTPGTPLAATINDVGVTPGDVAVVTVTLNRETTSDLSFTYATADDTALAGTNYTGVTSGSAMITRGQRSADIAVPTSSTPGVGYLGKRFVVGFTFATEPTLNHTATVSFSAAPPSTGTHVLRNKWAAFPPSSTTPSPRAGHSAIWTGKKLIIWGGYSGIGVYDYFGGAAYDPGTNSWAPISSVGAPSGRAGHVAVWTGAKMIVWGGADFPSGNFNSPAFWKRDGGVYDPATDTWSALPQSGSIPSARGSAAGVWDGARMIVWGGCSAPGILGDGAAYDLGTGVWVPIATANAPAARCVPAAVWTGARMIVWSGLGATEYRQDGAAYDPVTDTWTAISSAGAPASRYSASTAWTGAQMITWSGLAYSPATGMVTESLDGGVYDPGANVWSLMSGAQTPTRRYGGAGVWTGSSVIFWGGLSSSSGAITYLNDGGIYY